MHKIKGLLKLGCLFLIASCSQEHKKLQGQYKFTSLDKTTHQVLYVCWMADNTYEVTLHSEVDLGTRGNRNTNKYFTGKFHPKTNTLDIGDGVVLVYQPSKKIISYGDGDFTKSSDDCKPEK